MTQRLARYPAAGEDIERWADHSQSRPERVKVNDGRRFRRGRRISWTFVPMEPVTEPQGTPHGNAHDSLGIWIHAGMQDDAEAANALHLTDTNWLHIALNEDVSVSRSKLSGALEELRDVLDLLAETYSIASDRVYLASTGVEAGTALRLLLMEPATFRGIALFNSHLPSMLDSIDGDDRLKRVRALLVHIVHRDAAIREMFRLGRLLHSAGMQLTTHFCLPNQFSQRRLLAEWIANEQRIEPDWQCHW